MTNHPMDEYAKLAIFLENINNASFDELKEAAYKLTREKMEQLKQAYTSEDRTEIIGVPIEPFMIDSNSDSNCTPL